MRHGTTGANIEGKLQGTLDYPLSEAGIKEATLLAHRLKKQTFSLFFSSNLCEPGKQHILSLLTGKGQLLFFISAAGI